MTERSRFGYLAMKQPSWLPLNMPGTLASTLKPWALNQPSACPGTLAKSLE